MESDFFFIMLIAELERNIIVERVRAGIRRAKEQGKALGRPKRLNLDEKELIRLKEQGLSLREIARKVNVCPATVYKTLSKLTLKAFENQ